MSRGVALQAGDVERVEAILQRAAGITLSKALRRALQESFGRAADALKLEPQAFLSRLLAGDGESVSTLVEHSVIGETYFFRHPEQLAAFKKRVIQDFRSEGTLCVWSAGCASGEEPYSLAMTLLEARNRPEDRIIATDISERALSRAREGRYGSWSLRRVDTALYRRLFETEPSGEVCVSEQVRRMVQLRPHNLVADPVPMLGFHAIFCRNVLIYFQAETAARVLHKMLDALRPGGLLVLGPVEVPLAATLDLEWLDVDGVTLLRKPIPGERPRRSERRPASLQVVRHAEPSRPRATITPARVSVPEPPTAAASAPMAPAAAAAPASLFELARDAARKGQLEEAERLAQSSATSELLPESYLLLSIAAENRGDIKAAVDAVRRALYLEPNLATGHAALVPLFTRLGRPKEAERARRNALDVLEGMDESAVLQGVEEITVGALRRALKQSSEEASARP
jgi:chemotaxis protein methyltransferase CheR